MKKFLKITALLLVVYGISQTSLMPKPIDNTHMSVCKGCDPFP
jgi:hypothetical protein